MRDCTCRISRIMSLFCGASEASVGSKLVPPEYESEYIVFQAVSAIDHRRATEKKRKEKRSQKQIDVNSSLLCIAKQSPTCINA